MPRPLVLLLVGLLGCGDATATTGAGGQGLGGAGGNELDLVVVAGRGRAEIVAAAAEDSHVVHGGDGLFSAGHFLAKVGLGGRAVDSE